MSNCCSPNSVTIPCKGLGITFQLGDIGCDSGCGSGNGSGGGSENTDLSEIEKRLDELEQKQQNASPSFLLCEFYYLRNPKRPTGFEAAHGGIIEHAKDFYPKAWEYLQTDEGKELCITEDEWQAMTKAVYYTATSIDETGKDIIKEFSFDGVGGAPFYVQDLGAGTLRLPDLRGMYAEAAGFDGLRVGGVHGDMIRNIYGSHGSAICYAYGINKPASGAFYRDYKNGNTNEFGNYTNGDYLHLDVSRIVPIGRANKPRAWGANACVYLGTPNLNA